VWTDGRLLNTRALVDAVGTLRIVIHLNEHPPPHFHVTGNDINASFAIDDCALLRADIGSRERQLVEYWQAVAAYAPRERMEQDPPLRLSRGTDRATLQDRYRIHTWKASVRLAEPCLGNRPAHSVRCASTMPPKSGSISGAAGELTWIRVSASKVVAVSGLDQKRASAVRL